MAVNEDMEKTIQTIRGDNVELMKENAFLRKQIGGFKASNANYKKKVNYLSERVEHYKNLCKESDGLYESTVSQLEEKTKEADLLRESKALLEKEREELENKLSVKSEFISSQKEKYDSLRQCVSRKDAEIKDLEELVEHLQRPWWKKIF